MKVYAVIEIMRNAFINPNGEIAGNIDMPKINFIINKITTMVLVLVGTSLIIWIPYLNKDEDG